MIMKGVICLFLAARRRGDRQAGILGYDFTYDRYAGLLIKLPDHQQLQELLPQPALLLERADVTENPAPIADSTKSTLIGFTSSNNSLSTRKVIPCSLKVSSFSRGSSRAIPSAGPDHPPSFRVILMD